ncbi:MAG: LacI family DNA-binding transcriptional regulator [Tessaracoccus sp.]|uniref:LacI family DNA-binding transcriptional regulator n=1 Tax=Tessaracoccus sp. TaxID=1971211 RepID=UPI001EB1FC34|nr:LacI family DNA-binding transcriptional regulator [Tessaracoccus sp.]MBK7820008.1 LacI family DNA-binding transcriptional regulator [Tessaracoccus sp.]
MNAARRANLRDIAEASGVSIQTVSRVVRGLDVVAEPTRSRVMEAVARLGYRPNLAARSLSAHRTGQVHVIVTTPLYHGHATTFVSICQELDKLQFHAITTVPPVGSVRDLDPDGLVPVSADGAIVIGGRMVPAPWVKGLAARVPMVMVGRLHELPESVPGVAVDHRAGAVEAVRHLVARGARRIAHVAGPLHWVDAHLRLAGYREVCAEAGIEPLVLEADSWDARAALSLAKDLPADVDAVFASNDQLALGCMTALQQRGLRVPEDVKVVGFDDISGADAFLPALTTVRQDFTRVGELAVASLSQILAGEPARLSTLTPSLVVRAST